MRAASAILLLAGGTAAGLLAAGAGAELYLRATRPWNVCARIGPGERPNADPGVSWAAAHPELGWVSARMPGLNPQGFRDRRSFDALGDRTVRTRVMVLGDSFMWGAGLEPHETVPALLERELGPAWDVFNVSAPGWGVDQMVLAYRGLRDTIRPDVVLLAYIDEDVDRVLDAYRMNEGMNKPSFTLRGGELVARTGTETRGALAAVGQRSAAWRCATRELARLFDAPAIAVALLRTLAIETAGRGETLWIVRIPSREALDSGAGALLWRVRSLGRALAGASARYVELREAFERSGLATARLYRSDGHLSEAGAAVVAASVAPLLASEADGNGGG